MSVATHGANPLGLRSFAIVLSTTSGPVNGTAIDLGSYELSADTACDVLIGTGNITAVRVATVTSQPAAASPNRTLSVPAGGTRILEIPGTGYKIAAICDSGTGTLKVTGPLRRASLP